MESQKLKNILEAALLAANQPLSVDQLEKLFVEGEERPARTAVRDALKEIETDCEGRGFELKEVASGFRFQVRQDFSPWVGRLWEERPPRYSRAFLETLALIAYRQPITRAEIEDVRGVSVSSNIIKTLQERDWIRVVGHKDVPGKPAMYGTTRGFLDYFNLKTLDELPTLAELRDLDSIHPELAFEQGGEGQAANEAVGGEAEADALEGAFPPDAETAENPLLAAEVGEALEADTESEPMSEEADSESSEVDETASDPVGDDVAEEEDSRQETVADDAEQDDVEGLHEESPAAPEDEGETSPQPEDRNRD